MFSVLHLFQICSIALALSSVCILFWSFYCHFCLPCLFVVILCLFSIVLHLLHRFIVRLHFFLVTLIVFVAVFISLRPFLIRSDHFCVFCGHFFVCFLFCIYFESLPLLCGLFASFSAPFVSLLFAVSLCGLFVAFVFFSAAILCLFAIALH